MKTANTLFFLVEIGRTRREINNPFTENWNYMTETNFMLQDIASTLLGFFLFPLVIIVPGYVVGWFLDLLEFRRRFLHSRLALSVLFSFAVSPILFYLSSSLISFLGTSILLAFLVVVFIAIVFNDKPVILPVQNKGIRWVFIGAVVWTVFALFFLVDIQIGRELYYTVVGFDQATRISIVDAMARTGVPPVNPSYYPGYPVKLNFLYFFWYVLGGLVSFIGSSAVDARGAFFASTMWSGLGLMTAVSFYLRLRGKEKGVNIWTLVTTGIGLLTVTGLDMFPVILAMSHSRTPVPDIEHWNEQIGAWIGSVMWVPHHVAALVAGLTGIFLGLAMRGQTKKRQYILMTVAGAAFASALGLSFWVTFVFVLFWAGWLLFHFFSRDDRELVLPMIFAGVVALLLSASFMLGIFSDRSSLPGSGGGLPISFEMRAFRLLDDTIGTSSETVRTLTRILFLPINYFLELGFYFLAAVIWLRVKRYELKKPQYLVEVLLFGSSFFVGTFMRSTLIANNDLGWRSWLPGQFVLLIWGVDVLLMYMPAIKGQAGLSQRTWANLVFLAVLGLLTTLLDVGLLRLQPYLSGGKDFGERIYSARQAYTTIIQTLPENIVIQYNPAVYVNRPAGLYGMRQSAISDRTAYGISTEVYLERTVAIGAIFTMQNLTDWRPVDDLCEQYFIDILVIENYDPLWNQIDVLAIERGPYYLSEYFAVFPCGDFAASQLP